MEFKRNLVVTREWVYWLSALVPWLVLTVLVWDRADWIFRVLLVLVALVAAGGAWHGRGVQHVEFILDATGLRWGTIGEPTPFNYALSDICAMRHNRQTGELDVVFTAEAAKRHCAPGHDTQWLPQGFSRNEFIGHVRAHYPGIAVEVIGAESAATAPHDPPR